MRAENHTNHGEIAERFATYSGLPLNSSYELPFVKLLGLILSKSLVVSTGGTIFSKKKALIENIINPQKSLSEEMKESLEVPQPLEPDGWNLSEFLFNLKNSSDSEDRQLFCEIQEAFNALFPDLQVDAIYQTIKLPMDIQQGQQHNFQYPCIVVIDSRNSKQFSLEKVGAGIAECLFLLSASLGSGNRIVLLDEPAVNLHPAQMKALFQLLGNSSNQLFVITHSPPLLRNLCFERCASVIHVRRPEGKSVVSLLNPKSIWSDSERYKLSYLVDPRIFFARHVLISEGETDKEFLETTAQEFGMNPDTYEDIVIDARSKDNIPKYRKLLQLLATPFVVVGDDDKKSLDELRSRAIDYASEENYTVIDPKGKLPEALKGKVFFIKGNIEAFMMSIDLDLYNEVEQTLCESQINSKPVFIHEFLPKLIAKNPQALDNTIKPLLEYAFDINSRTVTRTNMELKS